MAQYYIAGSPLRRNTVLPANMMGPLTTPGKYREGWLASITGPEPHTTTHVWIELHTTTVAHGFRHLEHPSDGSFHSFVVRSSACAYAHPAILGDSKSELVLPPTDLAPAETR